MDSISTFLKGMTDPKNTWHQPVQHAIVSALLIGITVGMGCIYSLLTGKDHVSFYVLGITIAITAFYVRAEREVEVKKESVNAEHLSDEVATLYCWNPISWYDPRFSMQFWCFTAPVIISLAIGVVALVFGVL